MLVSEAPAKVNWTLDVLGRRADGYHEIATVLTALALHDTLTLTPADQWSLTIDAPEPLRSELTHGPNLMRDAVRVAAGEVAALLGQPAPVDGEWPSSTLVPAAALTLTKRIPAAAGLGGGSSDAAATLRLLRDHWRPALPVGVATAFKERLPALAARLGSDVPFFLRGGTQLATGRGEGLERLPAPALTWLALLTPALALPHKTATLYGRLRAEHFTEGGASAALADRLRASGGLPYVLTAGDLANTFSAVADDAFPSLGALHRRMQAISQRPVHLSGAGPTLFALARDEDTARSVCVRWQAELSDVAASLIATVTRPPAES